MLTPFYSETSKAKRGDTVTEFIVGFVVKDRRSDGIVASCFDARVADILVDALNKNPISVQVG